MFSNLQHNINKSTNTQANTLTMLYFAINVFIRFINAVSLIYQSVYTILYKTIMLIFLHIALLQPIVEYL